MAYGNDGGCVSAMTDMRLWSRPAIMDLSERKTAEALNNDMIEMEIQRQGLLHVLPSNSSSNSIQSDNLPAKWINYSHLNWAIHSRGKPLRCNNVTLFDMIESIATGLPHESHFSIIPYTHCQELEGEVTTIETPSCAMYIVLHTSNYYFN